MIHYLYRTTNVLTGKYYLGMHSTKNLDDGYIGSGKILRRSIKKYGLINHLKEVFLFVKTREELVQKEKELITEELLKDPSIMNLRLGGEGGGNWTNEQQRKNNEKSQQAQRKLIENNPQWVESRSRKLSEAHKRAYDSGKRPKKQPLDWTGRKHSEETKEKLSRIKKGIYADGKNPKAKKVKDDEENIFATYKECGMYHNIHPETVARRIAKGLYSV